MDYKYSCTDDTTNCVVVPKKLQEWLQLTPDTLNLGCSYHLHPSHCFFSLGMQLGSKDKRNSGKEMFRLLCACMKCL